MRTRLHRYGLVVFSATLVVAMISWVSAEQAGRQTAAAVPTFSKDVAPILYKNCTSCHRPGEIAPMSLMTYTDARPYTRAIFEEVEAGHMPPWHAEAPAGTFLNERGLSATDKATLMKWATGGAPEGNKRDLPPAPTYSEGWQLGTPDQVFEMTEPYAVPATGTINYEYFYIPTNFKEAKWVQSIEVRPGTRAAVHHVLVFYRSVPDRPRMPRPVRGNPELSRMPPPQFGSSPPRMPDVPGQTQRLIATYAPGTNPQLMPAGTAIRLEPGGIIELQMHYTAFGESVKDRTKVGITFSKESSPREVQVGHFLNATLVLPAGTADVQVDADLSFVADTTVYGLFPHTHLRGKRWRYILELPDGTKKVVLDVPRYDFNWQAYYMFAKPLEVPAGAKLVSQAWYDNSAKNPANPDPKVDVKWGDQTWEEMQYTGYLIAPTVKPPVK